LESAAPSPDPGSPLPLAAVLAGGRSRRFGAPKALARVGGVRVVDRVLEAARAVLPRVVLIANDPALAGAVDAPSRPDAVPDLGPLGGIHAALRWAEEEGRPGALCLPCDAPFLPPGLLACLLERAAEGDVDAVVPESTGPRKVEPLCAFYGVACRPQVEALAAEGKQSARALVERVRTARLPLEEVRRWGEPEVLFLNLNTPEDHRRAETLT
jgi:molybdopterin-guanine dinucleotide biosynthesis protein A